MNTLKNILREDHDEALRHDIRLLGRLLDAPVQAPARVASRGAMQEVIICSRPASRKKATAIENLRAIPRVFSWAQCRLMLPGRFGFGAAVSAYLEPDNAWPSYRPPIRSRPLLMRSASPSPANNRNNAAYRSLRKTNSASGWNAN